MYNVIIHNIVLKYKALPVTYENYFITSLVEGLDFSRADRRQCDMSNAMLVNILCSTWTVIRFPFFYMIYKQRKSCSVSYFILQRILN